MIVGKLKQDGELLTAGVDTRLPLVTSGLVQHYPFDGTTSKYFPRTFRYIRHWKNGSTANGSNHWYEISVIDYLGVNRALGILPTGSVNLSNAAVLTDGNTSGAYTTAGSGLQYVQIDLGEAYTIKEVGIWDYYNDGRTYLETKVEVSEDNITWYSIFDSAIEGTYKASSAGKILDLDNLGSTVSPITDSGTIINPDGIAIEQATTNLWTGALSIYNNYRQPAALTEINETYNGYPIYRLTMTVTDETRLSNFKTSLSGHGVYGSSTTFLANTKYAASIIWRPVNKLDTKLGGTTSNIGGWSSNQQEQLSNGWKRTKQTRNGTVTTDKRDTVFFSFACQSLELNEEIAIDFCCPQIELGDIATEYVSNSKPASVFTLPPSIEPTGSISFDYYCKNNNAVTVISNKQFGGSWWGVYINAAGKLYMHEGNASGNFTSTYTVPLNTWFRITLTWNNTAQYLYADGVLLGSIATNTTNALPKIPEIYLGYGWNRGNAVFKNLSVYNRVLSEDEILKLSKGTHSFTKGGLIQNSISTRNLTEGVTFPLDQDGKDYHKYLEPTRDLNTVYENSEGGVWVGKEAVNTYSTPDFNTTSAGGGWSHWGGAGHKGSSGQNTDREFIYGDQQYSHWVNNDSTATGDYLMYQSPAFAGGFRSLQCIVRLEDGSDITKAKLYPQWNAPSGGASNHNWTSVERLGDSPFYRCTVQGLKQDGSNNLIGVYVKPGIKAYFTFMQLEHNEYPTPLIKEANRTRAASSLHLPYEVIDCKKDFTIYGWMKPGITNFTYQAFITRNIPSSNATGRRILFMTNGTAGKMHLWFGSGGQETTLTGPATLLQAQEWNFCALTRVGGTINMYVGNSTGFSKASGGVGTYLNTDETGRVWQFEYNGTKSNSYHRDYSFIQRGLSDSEIEAVHKTKMKALQNELKFSNINTVSEFS